MKTIITKRLALLTLLALSMSTMSFAQDKKITAAQLPAAAQNFIKQHFKGQTVTSANMNKEMFDTDYETVLSNGVKINFDANGSWDEIDCKTGVPPAVIPKSIAAFINANYKGQNIVQIDKKIAGYDLELSSGTELEFDNAGKFLRIDD
jgi:hypothetical protein